MTKKKDWLGKRVILYSWKMPPLNFIMIVPMVFPLSVTIHETTL